MWQLRQTRETTQDTYSYNTSAGFRSMINVSTLSLPSILLEGALSTGPTDRIHHKVGLILHISIAASVFQVPTFSMFLLYVYALFFIHFSEMYNK